MREKGAVREVVGVSTVAVSLGISRGFLMNTTMIYFSEGKAVEKVALVLRGRAKAGGETRVVAMDSHLHSIIVVAHSIWSEIAHMVRGTGREKQPKLISAQHLPTK